MKKGLLSLLALAILVLSFVSGFMISNTMKGSNTKYPESFKRLYEVYSILDNSHYSDPDEEKLVNGAIMGMLEILDDDYTFIDGNPLFDYEFNDTNQKKGLNLELSIPLANGYPVVKSSPYMKTGSSIIRINGNDTFKMSVEEMTNSFKSDCYFDILENGRVSTVYNPFTEITFAFCEGKMIGTTGYIKINTFNSSSIMVYEQFLEQLSNLEELQMKGLIIDLRDNQGGTINNVAEIINIFATGGIADLLYSLEGKNPETLEDVEKKYFPLSNNSKKEYDVKLLVNKNTAAEAEIMASVMAVQGYEVIGEKTAGRNTYQDTVKINDQCTLRISTGAWYYYQEGIKKDVSGGFVPTAGNMNLYYDEKKPMISANIFYDSVSGELASVQKMLVSLGYDVRIDGYFDNKTSLLVQTLTSKNYLDQAGIDIIYNTFLENLNNNDLLVNQANQLLGGE